MYFLAQNHEKTGPFTLEQLREMWRVGAVYPQTLYWEEGLADWQPLDRIAATVLILPSGSAPAPSAYDLPTFHLPAAPAGVHPVTLPVTTLAPSPVGPASTHALIAPTSLPPGNMGAAVGPLGPAKPEMPPSAYLSLIFAVLGPFCMVFGHGLGFLPGLGMCVAAVVCGHTARAAIRASGDRLPGTEMATTGLVLGYGCLGLGVLVILLIVAFFIFGIGGAYLMSNH